MSHLSTRTAVRSNPRTWESLDQSQKQLVLRTLQPPARKQRRRSAPPSSRDWDVPPGVVTRRDKFCRVCEKIDIEGYLNKSLSDPIKLGKLKDICSICPFCRLIRESVQNWALDEIGETIYLANEKSWKSCVVKSMYGDKGRREGYSNLKDLESMANRTSGRKAYRYNIFAGDKYWKTETQIGQIQYLADKEPMDQRHFFGRRVNARVASLDLIKSWLPLCQKIHGRSCEESGEASKRLPWLRVIDVDSRIVVSAPAACRYIALSYVWGHCEHFKSTKAHLKQRPDGSEYIELPPKLPQTIEDSINVVRALGERYLWVDAICIIQDSASERHTQILRMDAIYNSSVLTIAAASGADADSGLPGISRARKVAQRTESADGLRFAQTFPTYADLEKDESLIWNSRGWTFQERILSKRLLIFTEYQVYFQCSNTVWCEDTAMETDRCSKSVEKQWRPLRWAADRHMGENTKEAGVTLSNYIYVVKAFTKRVITNREDGVNAVQGILGTLESEMGEFFFGIPEDYFGSALMWQPTEDAAVKRFSLKTAPFPSWSWARWQFEDGCTWFTTRLASSVFDWPFHIITPHEMITLNEGVSNRAHLRGWLSRRKLRPENTPYPEVSRVAQEILRRTGALLYICPRSAKLWFGDLWKPKENIMKLDRLQQFVLSDRHGSNIGRIWSTPATASSSLDGIKRSFIALGATTGYEGPTIAKKYIPTKQVAQTNNETTTYITVELKEYEYKIVQVMLVEWIDDVAQRLALGEVVETAWNKHSKASRWMLLG